MKQFAVVVLADYAENTEIQTEPLGVFEQQLEEHRTEVAAARKKKKASNA